MISSVLFAPFRRFKMSDDEKREDRKRKADSKEETEKEKEKDEDSDSDDGEMIGPMPTEAAPTKKPKVRNRVGFWDVAKTQWQYRRGHT